MIVSGRSIYPLRCIASSVLAVWLAACSTTGGTGQPGPAQSLAYQSKPQVLPQQLQDMTLLAPDTQHAASLNEAVLSTTHDEMNQYHHSLQSGLAQLADQIRQDRLQKQTFSTEQALFLTLVTSLAGVQNNLSTAVSTISLVAYSSRDPQLARWAVEIALYAKQQDTADTLVQHWRTLAPTDQTALEYASRIQLMQGNYAAAESLLAELLVLQTTEAEDAVVSLSADQSSTELPSTQQPFQALALKLAKVQPEQALEMMQTLVEPYADQAHAQIALGHLYRAFEQWQPAREAYDEALQLDAHAREARLSLADTLSELNSNEQALLTINQGLALNPDDRELLLTQARLLISSDRLQEASAAFQALVTRYPEDTGFLYTTALLELDAGRLDTAKTYFEQLLPTSRINEAYYYLGRIAEQQDNHQAHAYYQQVAQGEYWLDARIRSAHLLARQGEITQAREQLQLLQASDETKPALQIRLYLAEMLLLREVHAETGNKAELEAVIVVAEQGLAEFPDNSELLYWSALTADQLDQVAQAEKFYLRLLARDPQNADALNAYGYMLTERTDRYQEAYELIQQAHAMQPDSAAIADSMGWVLYKLGRYDEALDYLQQALTLQYDPEIAAHLGEVLWVTGQQKQARLVWQAALQQSPQHPKLQQAILQYHGSLTFDL